MVYTPVVGTLGYVLSPDRRSVLMIHRITRPDDQAFGKYNGLGGKMEAGEDVVTCMKREIREEAGLDVVEMRLRGTISWPGFGKHGEDWLGFVFLITAFTGQPLRRNAEGTLEWVPVTQVLNEEIPMWPGDKYFLPLVFSEDPRQFHGLMPYRDGQPIGWSYTLL